MAENRSVIIRVRAETGDFTAKMAALGKSVSATSREMTSAEKHAVKFRQGLTSVGDAAGKIGLVAGAGLAAVVATTANFEQAMSKVQAATHETASGMDALREAAIQAGADTAFSASEAAAGIENLSKAGVGTGDILGGGLTGALDLAAAGTIEVAEAAEIAATTMTQFGLAGEEIPHIADLLAAAAGKAQGEVTDMANSLKYVGPVAAQMGVSLEETTGAIALLASQGILGDQAGTSLRGMLTALTSPSKQAATEMKNLGISMYDVNGQFIGLEGIAGQLQATMTDLGAAERDAALGRIFGNEQITAARILYAGGAEEVRRWTNEVNDSGYAAETAAIKLDNLKGDWEAFTGSLETALIGAGEGSQGMLRGLVQGATDAVNAFNDLPPTLKNVSSGMLAITAISGGGLWFGAKMVTGIAETRAALSDLGPVGTKAAGALGKVGKAAGIAGAAFAGFAAADAISRIGDDAVPGIEELTTKLLDLADAGVAAKIGADFDDLGTSIDRLTDKNWSQTINDNLSGMLGGLGSGRALREARADIDGLDSALAQLASGGHADIAADALDNLIAAQGLSATEAEQLLSILPQYGDALAGIENDAKLAGEATSDAAGGFSELGGAAADGAEQVDAFAAALDGFNAVLADRANQRAYREALRSFNEGLKEAPENMKRGSEAWDEMEANLDDIAGSALDVAETLQGTERVRYLAQARRDFIQAAVDMGIPKKAARDLADELGLLDKKDPRITVTADVAQATGAIADVRALLQGLDGKVARTFVRTIIEGPQNIPQYVAAPRKASGGYISGPGTATSDSIPAYLSNGEYVIKAAAVAKYGTAIFDQLNAMRFASGGYVAGRDYRTQTTQTTTSTTNHYYSNGGPVEIAGQLRIPGIGLAEIRGVVESVLNDSEAFKGTLRRAN